MLQKILDDPTKRPPAQLRAFTSEVQGYVIDQAVQLERDRFVSNLRRTRKGLSAGLGGTRNELLKVNMDDDGALDDLVGIAQRLAEADVSREVVAAMRMCSLTAIRQEGGRMRGLIAGGSFRRLVARTLAQ